MNDKFDTLKGEIAEVIKPNGQRLIKGGNHQATLFKVVDAMEGVDAESKARDTAIEVKVTANTDAIAAVDGRVTANEEVIADHETRITDNTSAIADNKAELTRQGGVIDGHSHDITDIKHKDAEQDAHLTQIDGSLGEISGDIEGIHQTDNVQNDAIADLQGKVADLADSALAFDVTPLVNAIGGKISEAFGKELIHAIRAGKWLYAKANQDTYYRIISCGVRNGKRIFTSAEGREVRNIYLDGLSVSLDTHVIGADVHIFNNRESVNILNLTTLSSAAHIKEVFTDSFGEVLIPHTGDIFNIHANSDVMHSGIVVSSVEDRAEIRIAVDMSNFEDNLVHRVFYKIYLPAQGFDSIEITGKSENIINPSKIAEDAIDRMQGEINANKGGIAENKQTIATNKTEAERAIAKVANEVNEYNISHINKTTYTLQGAISALNAYLGDGARTIGIKVTFVEDVTMKPYTYVYKGGSFVSPSSWVDEIALLKSCMYNKPIAMWDARGRRNDEPEAERKILRDLSGHGHDLSLNNFAWAGFSGFGGHVLNFMDHFSIGGETKKRTESEITFLSVTSHIVIARQMTDNSDSVPSLSVRIYGLKTEEKIRFQYYEARRDIVNSITINGNGFYILPKSDKYNKPGDYYFYGFVKNDDSQTLEGLTIEQVDVKPNCLVFDGVDDYAICNNMPFLYDGYTIIAEREFLEPEKDELFCQYGFNEMYSPFSFERTYKIGNLTYSYDRAIEIGNHLHAGMGVSFQTSKTYNGLVDIPSVYNRIGNHFVIGRDDRGILNWKGAFSQIHIFDHDMSPLEIEAYIQCHINPNYKLPK